MFPLVLGLVAFAFLVLVAAVRDPVGFGLLLSSNVERVAQARLEEPPLGIPPLYVIASAVAGAGAVLSFAEVPLLVHWVFGVLLATFLLTSLWDLRRRRGTLAVYIRLRRAELGFEPRGEVIEVPKLVFLVMNQPTPLVWLATSIVLGAAGIALLPYESWPVMLPLAFLALAIFWLWLHNRRSPWERLARRLRWVSLRSGDRLIERLHEALDLDPEVIFVRMAADAAVARFMTRDS
ncbi:hypothetical protein EG835_15030 [bacterium]|nr:hypothetical protein [bacterium]